MRTAKILIAIALIAVFMVPGMVTSTVSMPARADVMWCTGYDGDPNTLSPLKSNPNYGVQVMYEPLFGKMQNGTVIPVIGKSYWWQDAQHIQVALNPDAKWSNGKQITADDVIKSYELTAMNRLSDMKTRYASIEGSDDGLNVTFALEDEWAWSYQAEFWITSDVPILPWEGVWSEINGTADYLADGVIQEAKFDNNWLTDGFKESWKVCSGPYVPYWKSTTENRWLFKLRSDWWGNGKIYSLCPDTKGVPQIPYLGWVQTYDNDNKNTWLITNQVDWHAGFYKNVKTAMAINPMVQTYYGNSTDKFIQPLSGIIGLAFNHDRFPFSEVWFRRACSWGIDYAATESAAVGNYWAFANAVGLNDLSPAHAPYFNKTINDAYQYSYNVSKAVEILSAHCYQKSEGGKMVWYTNDGEAEAAYLADGSLFMPWRMGNHHNSTDGASLALALDEDTTTTGTLAEVNIKLGGFEIVTPAGWSDVDTAMEYSAMYLSYLFNSTVLKHAGDQTALWVNPVGAGDFDCVMQCCGPWSVNDVVTFMGGFRGAPNIWANDNITRWDSMYAAIFEGLFEQMEVKMLNTSSNFQEVINGMQAILADQIPYVGLFYNGLWYQTNVQYWMGYETNASVWNDYASPSMSNKMAIKTAFILNLFRSTNAPQAQIPWTGLEIASAIGVVAVVAAILVKRKRVE